MKIKILCDSSCDLTKQQIKENDLDIIAFPVILGDNEYRDGETITSEQIIAFTEKTKIFPKTAALNQFEYEEFFGKYADDDTVIIYFGLSKELSASYGNSVEAAKKFKNIYIIDGMNLAIGTGSLVLKACELRKQGFIASQIVEKINAIIPKLHTSFIVEKIDYLRKGGRCSMLAAFGANLFKIKPTLIIKEGKIIADKKFMGKHEECLKKYIAYILENFPNKDKKAYIAYSPLEEGQLELVQNLLTEAGFKEIGLNPTGATITCHCGPGTLGVIYNRE